MYPKIKPSSIVMLCLWLCTWTLTAQNINYTAFDSVLVQVDKSDNAHSGILKVSKQDLRNAAGAGLKILDYNDKVSSFLDNESIQQEVGIVFHDQVSEQLLIELANQYQLTNIDKSLADFNVVEATIPGSMVRKLAENPAVLFVDKKQKVSPLTVSTKKILHRALGERTERIENLTGKDVVIGMGDIGSLGSHIDYGCNVHDFVEQGLMGYARHADHVAGIIFGKGYLDPTMQGIASGATLLVETTTDIVLNAQRYFDDYNMTITNNSYGIDLGCITGSDYNYMSGILDDLSFKLPKSIHVFAAGNSGLINCSGQVNGYSNLLKFYGTSKNVLTVGNVNNDFMLSATSSKGPTYDGRIKPEITAVGDRVLSTGPDNTYFENSGTSMAAPVVSGVLGLMTQAYKEQYQEQPTGGLLKAIICNTATDAGNKGPDFGYGFGVVNAEKAIEVIEKQQFTTAQIKSNESQTFTVKNSGSAPLKILLYWNDPKALPYPEKALVNNLDLKVIAPSGKVFNPLVADINNPTAAARAQRDTINNIEQVIIDNPEIGTYRVVVSADKLTSEQTFYWTYFQNEDALRIAYPAAGDILPMGAKGIINWGGKVGKDDRLTILFKESPTASTDVIYKNIKANDRTKNWFLPNKPLENASLEIVNETTQERYKVKGLKIVPTLTQASIARDCESIVTLSWKKVPEATAYEVAQITCNGLENTQITPLPYIDLEVGFDEAYFVITPIFGQHKGIRSQAIAKPIESGAAPCDGDIRLVSLDIPSIGRALTSISLTSREVSVMLKNLGQDTAVVFTGGYSLNDDVNTTVFTQKVKPTGLERVEAFRFPEILPGEYLLKGHIAYKGEKLDFEKKLIQLPNKPVQLPFQTAFENAASQWYESDKMGLDGINRWDVALYDGEAHTYDGINLLSYQTDIFQNLTGTFNLEGISEAELIVKYESTFDGEAILEYRKDDQSEWQTLTKLNEEKGTYSKVLQASFTSSSQIRIRSSHNTFKLKMVSLVEPQETELTVRQSFDELHWEVNRLEAVDYFVVQIEKDGSFETLDVLEGTGKPFISIEGFDAGATIRITAVLKNGQSVLSKPIVLKDEMDIRVSNLIDDIIPIQLAGQDPIQIQLVSTQGGMVFQETVNPTFNTEFTIQAAHLNSGIYVLHFSKEGMRKSVKVVKP